MCATSIDYTKLYSADFCRIPRRAGHRFRNTTSSAATTTEQVPVEGLIEAAASVLRREGSKLAIYNLGLGPLGYPGLRKFVADKASDSAASTRRSTIP